MASITNVGSSVTAPPADANRPSAGESARNTTVTPNIDPMAQPKFVDRRRRRDRRTQMKRPLLDTRRNKDRRRTGRFEAKI